ncbi:MAG: helix-turn-helix transcriptional regulator [Actinomycetota bacterium]|jgi:DNA-binding PadR family transcriptional regulator
MSSRRLTVQAHIKPLNPTGASILGFLHRGPLTGWDIARMAEMVIGDFWNVTASQVYRELRALETMGMVEAGATGTRARRPYTITDDGRAAFTTFIHQEPGADLLRSPLLLMVFFGRHLDPVYFDRFLAIHRLRHEQALDSYKRVRATVDPAEVDILNILEYAVLHEEAVLAWFEWMADRKPGAGGRGPATA